MRWHPRRARTDPQNPEAWATSDRNGMISNKVDMKWQWDWAGSGLINKRILISQDELDVPQRQLGSLILPPDPPPIMDARPEPYAIDEASSQPYTTEDGIDFYYTEESAAFAEMYESSDF